MPCAGRDSRFPPFRTGREKMGHPLRGGVRLGDTGSLDCARDDRLFRVCTSEDARAFIDWRGLLQRSFVGSRVCATPLPQDDSGRLACPWAFSRVVQSREATGLVLFQKWMAGAGRDFRFPPFRNRRRKDGAPPSWWGEIGRHRVPRLRSG
jgi:hypothetical protein